MLMCVEADVRPGEAEMSTTQSQEADLCTAIAYLHDLDAELEERSGVRSRRINSAVREDMLYQLDHARELVVALERRGSNIACLSYHDGGEVLIDLRKARAWCHLVEAKIMRVCEDELDRAFRPLPKGLIP
jgi:hypothetical protein